MVSKSKIKIEDGYISRISYSEQIRFLFFKKYVIPNSARFDFDVL